MSSNFNGRNFEFYQCCQFIFWSTGILSFQNMELKPPLVKNWKHPSTLKESNYELSWYKDIPVRVYFYNNLLHLWLWHDYPDKEIKLKLDNKIFYVYYILLFWVRALETGMFDIPLLQTELVEAYALSVCVLKYITWWKFTWNVSLQITFDQQLDQSIVIYRK